jgi:serine protease Do
MANKESSMIHKLKLLLHFTFIVILYLITLNNTRASNDGYADLIDKVASSVVNISSTQVLKNEANFMASDDQLVEELFELFKRFSSGPINPYGLKPIERKTLGSGFIVDPAGYIVTNYHVIEDSKEIEVTLTENISIEPYFKNTLFKAEVVGVDPQTDLALLKIESKTPLPFVKFADSNKARVGNIIITIGNPFALGRSVSAGIISAKHQELEINLMNDFLQTDASINRGNSGGPMFNLDGEVIGVNTAILSPTGGSVGVGFAIPSSITNPIIEQLKTHKRVIRSYIGVTLKPLDKDLVENLGLSEAKGCQVVDIDHLGPANTAGIKVGDIITKYNGEEIPNVKILIRKILKTPIGQSVKIEVMRKLKPLTLTLQVAEAPEKYNTSSKANIESSIDIYGVKISSLEDEMKAKYKMDKKMQGVIITHINKNSPWSDKGLKEGDIVANINQVNISKPSDVKKVIDKAKKDNKNFVSILIIRPNESLFIPLPLY